MPTPPATLARSCRSASGSQGLDLVKSAAGPAAAGNPAAAGQVELAAGVDPLQHPLSGHRSELAGQRAKGGLRTTPAT